MAGDLALAGVDHEPQAGAATQQRHEATGRLVSLDAARGLAITVMLLAMHPGPNATDPAQLQHPAWHGLTFADLFFPLFLFAIGVSMVLSPRSADLGHVLHRAALLAVLGVALASLKHERFAATGVLQHIAAAYVLAYVILRGPRRWQSRIAVGLLAVYWLAFVVWAWADDAWAQSGTLAHAVDGAVLGGFTSEGVLQSAIGAVTIVGGAAAGYLVRNLPDRRELASALAKHALVLIGVGLVLALVVPINKRLWTPSFAVLTIGTSFAWFALGVRLIDVGGRRRLVAPLVHLGRNPIAVYIVFMTVLALIENHARDLFPTLVVAGSPTWGSVVYAVGWTGLGLLFAYALHRRRILIKI